MIVQEIRIISKHFADRLQVCFIGTEVSFNRRGKKMVRKVSKTRHLRFTNGCWWGSSLDKANSNAFSLRNYSEWITPTAKVQLKAA